jgi:hypothetical protein
MVRSMIRWGSPKSGGEMMLVEIKGRCVFLYAFMVSLFLVLNVLNSFRVVAFSFVFVFDL